MARVRDQNRDKAYELWKEAGGLNAPKGILSEIAEKLGKSPEQIRKWKNSDKWESNDDVISNVTNSKSNVTIQKEKKEKKIKDDFYEKVLNSDLTEKQKLFCIYYIQSFNATQSAIKAGYSKESAYSIGFENLRKHEIKTELERLKELHLQELYLENQRILNRHAQIAFSDMTDYLDEFGKLKNLSEVDGTLIKKIKIKNKSTVTDFGEETETDISLELEDRSKSLEFLTKFKGLDPKTELEKQKLDIEKQKNKIDGELGEDEPLIIEVITRGK